MARDGAALKQLAMDGQPPPEWSIPPPIRWRAWSDMTIACFWDVNTERPTSAGLAGVLVGQLPWSRIVEWARLHALPPRETKTLIHAVRQMDAAYLAIERERMKTASKHKE